MLKSSPILFALARTPENKGPRTSRLLLWFARWPFAEDLCGFVAVLDVGPDVISWCGCADQ